MNLVITHTIFNKPNKSTNGTNIGGDQLGEDINSYLKNRRLMGCAKLKGLTICECMQDSIDPDTADVVGILVTIPCRVIVC
jgi:hypothetical protein